MNETNRPMTEDERKENEAAIAETKLMLAKVSMARAAIVEKHDGRVGVKGVMPCPACKAGKLYYLIHKTGHIHGQCTHSDCVNWME